MQTRRQKQAEKMLWGCPSLWGIGFHADFQWTPALSVASTLGNGFVWLLTRSNNVSGLFMQGVRYSHLDCDSGHDVSALEAALISDTIQKGLWTRSGPKLCPNQQWGKYHLRA